MISVLLVDDSPLVLNILQRLLSRVPEIQVVGTAANGKEALDLLPALNPDVICTDLHMPVMNGLELTCAVMSSYPRPILVISVSVEAGSPNVFKLLEAGALDVFPKPRAIQDADFDTVADELASRIRILAGVRVLRRNNHTTSAPMFSPMLSPMLSSVVSPMVSPITSSPIHRPRPQAVPRIVVIGASTGGPQALREILSCLPATFPLPVVCIQHIGGDFLSGMLAWLDDACALTVRKAHSGEAPLPRMIYFAPADAHLEFDGNGRFLLSMVPPIDGHRPSITATMQAAARYFGSGTVGVLLTGMGRDGADGIASIAAAGGITIAQDEASSVVYGMPKEAVALGAVQHILPLEQIAPALEALLNNSSSANRTGS